MFDGARSRKYKQTAKRFSLEVSKLNFAPFPPFQWLIYYILIGLLIAKEVEKTESNVCFTGPISSRAEELHKGERLHVSGTSEHIGAEAFDKTRLCDSRYQ